MSEEKPKELTGWVAWHPNERTPLRTCSMSKQGCEDRLINAVYGFQHDLTHACAETYFAARDVAIVTSEKDGWRIRPVKIVFTDEEGER